MTIEPLSPGPVGDAPPPMPDEDRPLGRSLWRGWRLRCPRCGDAPLFAGFLRVRDVCNRCGEALHHHRADDAPPYLTILIVGHLTVPAIVLAQHVWAPPLYATMAVSALLVSGLALALLRPIKGAVVGLQWAHRMHGFGGHND